MKAKKLTSVVVFSLASAVMGQSFNVDVGTTGAATAGFGPPAATFGGAAAQPGTWNNFTGLGTGPLALVMLDGSPSTVTLSRNSGTGGNFGFNNANTSGDFQLLLDDLQDVGGVGQMRTYTFTGLAPGTYTLVTYACAPDNATFSSNVTVPGSTSTNPQAVTGALPVNAFALGVTHASHDVAVVAGAPLMVTIATGSGFGSVNGFQLTTTTAPSLVDIVSANPPTDNPFMAGTQPFRDVLATGPGATVTQGIGATGTPAEDSITYDPINVTFSGTPTPAPAMGNVTIACTGGTCPTVTGVAGAGVGPYQITLSGAIPTGECTTLTFAGTNAGQKVQYQSLPTDLNYNGSVAASDVLLLVVSINNGMATLPANLARFDINRNSSVSAADVLRAVGQQNGVNSPQAFLGATVTACPP